MYSTENGFAVVGFAFGVLFGVVISMAVNEYRGSRIEGGTLVFPTPNQCTIETKEFCEFTSIGIYTPIKDI